MKSVHFSVDLAFEITLKQQTNFCNQSQTDTCRNNQWLSLDFDCRQTSAISTDKTFAVRFFYHLKSDMAKIPFCSVNFFSYLKYEKDPQMFVEFYRSLMKISSSMLFR